MTAERAALAVGLLLTLGVAVLAVRFHGDAGPLWRDEVNSVNVAARSPLAAVIAAAPYDSFPLAWPLTLHAWIAAGLGESDAALRLLGTTIAMATLALVCDVGTDLLARRWRHGPLARVVAVAAVALGAAAPVTEIVRLRMTNLDLVAATVARDAKPSDLVVVFPWHMGITFDRYHPGDLPWITLPEPSGHDVHVHLEIRDRLRRGADGVAVELERVESVLRAGSAVWLVGEPMSPPPGQPAPSLPPAPNAPSGWRAGPYLDMWELQLGTLVRAHALAVERVPLPDAGPMNAWENPPLYRATGWR